MTSRRRWFTDSILVGTLALLCACTEPPPEAGPVARVRPMAAEPRPVAFQVAAVRDGSLALARLGDQLLLVTHHESFHIDEMGRLVATDLTRPDAAEVYIEPFQFWPAGGYWRYNYELAGRWPDGVWALFQGSGYERTPVPRAVIQRKGREWIRHDTFAGEAEWSYGAIFEWKDGQVLGLRIEGARQAPLGQGEYTLRAARDRRPGARFDVLGDRIEPAWPQIDPELIFVAAASSARGELFVAGYKRDDDDNHVFVQRWDPNGGPRTGVVDELPGKFAIHRLVVGAGDHAYLAGAQADAETAYLAAFDGVTWSQEPVPEGRWIRDLALAPGGDLWAVVELESATALHRRPVGRAWERVTLSAVDLPVGERWRYDQDWQPERVQRVAADGPLPVLPVRVEARGDDDVWVLAEVDDRDVLLRSSALPGPPLVIAGHDRQSAAREDARPVERWAPGAVCLRGEGPFVRLWKIPDGAAEDAAVPIVETFVKFAGPLRSYVRGIHEFDDNGGRVAGLFVDAAIPASKLKRLRAALQRAAPGEPHEFVCRRPPILRVFDPVTGKPEP